MGEGQFPIPPLHYGTMGLFPGFNPAFNIFHTPEALNMLGAGIPSHGQQPASLLGGSVGGVHDSDDDDERRAGARKKVHLQGRFSGRLETKEHEKALVAECKLLGPLLGGRGKRGEQSRNTLAKIVRAMATGEIREYLELREKEFASMRSRMDAKGPDTELHMLRNENKMLKMDLEKAHKAFTDAGLQPPFPHPSTYQALPDAIGAGPGLGSAGLSHAQMVPGAAQSILPGMGAMGDLQGMPQPGMPGPVSAPGMSDAFASGLPLGVGTSAGPGLPHLPMSMPPQGLMHPQDGP